MTDPTALIALRSEHPASTPEAELVGVEYDPGRITLVLDDGITLSFDALELHAAVTAPGTERSLGVRRAA